MLLSVNFLFMLIVWTSYNVTLWPQSLKVKVLAPRACLGFRPVTEVKADTEKWSLQATSCLVQLIVA